MATVMVLLMTSWVAPSEHENHQSVSQWSMSCDNKGKVVPVLN